MSAVTYGRDDDGIATIALNRPDHGNALNGELSEGFAAAAERAAADADARVILLRAAGRNFCVGGDLTEFGDGRERRPQLAAILAAMHRGIAALHATSKPVVAAVQGAAAGGGLGISLVADAVVAAPSARFVFAYPGIGLTADCGVSWLLPRIVGPRRAFAMALAAESVSAEDAVEIGLATWIAPAEELQQRARELALRMAGTAPEALGECRRLMLDGLDGTLADALQREEVSILRAIEKDRTQELIDEFLNRRG